MYRIKPAAATSSAGMVSATAGAAPRYGKIKMGRNATRTVPVLPIFVLKVVAGHACITRSAAGTYAAEVCSG